MARNELVSSRKSHTRRLFDQLEEILQVEVVYIDKKGKEEFVVGDVSGTVPKEVFTVWLKRLNGCEEKFRKYCSRPLDVVKDEVADKVQSVRYSGVPAVLDDDEIDRNNRKRRDMSDILVQSLLLLNSITPTGKSMEARLSKEARSLMSKLDTFESSLKAEDVEEG